MTNARGYKASLLVKEEATYGQVLTDITGFSEFKDMTTEMENTKDLVDKLFRSGKVDEVECEVAGGKEGGTVSISGVLTHGKIDFLLKGASCDNTPTLPYLPNGQDSTSYSTQFMRVYGESDVVDIARGCVLETLEFTNDDNFINFSATYKAKEVLYAVDSSGYDGSSTEITCEPPYKVSTFLVATGTISDPLSFTLSINNEFEDDKVAYGIGSTKVREVLSKTTSSFTVEGLLDIDVTPIAIGATEQYEFSFGDGTDNVDIELGGTVESYSLPDAERGVFMNAYTLRLLRVGTDPSWSISSS